MIKLIVLDVDGTLTNGKIFYGDSEYKAFCVKDGLGITSWHRLGFVSAIITGRNSKIVEKRANELGIKYLYQGIKNKKEILLEILDKEKISLDEIAVIGDDLNDIGMIKLAKISFAPNNANKYIKSIVDINLASNGGDGAVREMIEYLIDINNLNKEFISLWE